MEKPLSVKREEFLLAIVNAINNSGLPPFMVYDVMKDITSNVERLAREQLEADKKSYYESLQANETDKDGTK